MKHNNGKQTAAKISAAVASGDFRGPTAIAKYLGINRVTVHRHLRDIAPALEEAEKLREEYRAQVARESPGEVRAKRVSELIGQSDQLMVALKAVMYADRVLGVAPVAENEAASVAQPLFALPPGARVAVKVD